MSWRRQLGRRIGEKIAATEGQTQARWQTMWVIDDGDALLRAFTTSARTLHPEV